MLHTLHTRAFSPSSVQVACLIICCSSEYECPLAGIVSDSVAPHLPHTLCRLPSVSHAASVSTIQLPYVCSVHAAGLTVILHTAVLPFELLAVIFAFPADFAVTVPFELTSATLVFDELQLTALSVLSLGVIDAVSDIDSPSFKLTDDLFRVMPVGSICNTA